jgi:hypothetical protein
LEELEAFRIQRFKGTRGNFVLSYTDYIFPVLLKKKRSPIRVIGYYLLVHIYFSTSPYLPIIKLGKIIRTVLHILLKIYTFESENNIDLHMNYR